MNSRFLFSLPLAGCAALACAAVSIFFFFPVSFGTAGVFAFFLLALGCSFLRPERIFFLLLAVLPFEAVDLASGALSVSVRPYQLLLGALLSGLLARGALRTDSILPKPLRWFDALPIAVALGGFLVIPFAPESAPALRQAILFLSFVALYFVSRRFLRNAGDAFRAIPFFLVGAVFSLGFAIFQGIRFSIGLPAFEAMSGRANAFFSEPDWFGMFGILVASLALSWLFRAGEGNVRFRILSFAFLFASFLGLILTVSRSAWAGAILSVLVFLKLSLIGGRPFEMKEWRWRRFGFHGLLVSVALVLAVSFASFFRLTAFDLADRAGSSVSGFQTITVSCDAAQTLPERIRQIEELAPLGCRHIRLEEIDTERANGRFVGTTLRPDPSIEARRAAREAIASEIQRNWLFGIGWGSIGTILGTDDRGNAFNASNVFLEVWLGAGLLGGVAFLVLWCAIPILAARRFFALESSPDDRGVALLYLASWAGFTLFNLANSGLLLGLVWVWLGGIGLLFNRKTSL